jgi:hypothetical protein
VSRTWLAARPPPRRRPNHHRRPHAGVTGSMAIARQARGVRGGQRRRERWTSHPGHLMGGALGGDGGYATPKNSEPAEAKRLRRRIRHCHWETARQRTACWSRPGQNAYRGRPWRRTRGMHEHKPFDGGRSRLSRRRAEREGCRSRVIRRVWRGAAETPRPLLVHGSAGRPNRGEPCGRGWGVPGTSLHVRSPYGRHAFASGVPPKIRGEKPGSGFPAGLIVTASRIGPMPERMSLNLMGSCRPRSRCQGPA